MASARTSVRAAKEAPAHAHAAPTCARPRISVSLAGVPQRCAAFERGVCYALLYGDGAAQTLEHLQLLIEAAGFEEATLAPWLWPQTAPNQLRKELEQLAARGFDGAVGVFTHLADAGEDAFAAFLLAAAQVAADLPYPVLVAARTPPDVTAAETARLAAAAGLVPITHVGIAGAPPLTDGMRSVAHLAETHAARSPNAPGTEPLAAPRRAATVPVGFAPSAP